MAADIHTIKNELKENCFFTGRREMIEFLLGEDLNPAEEFALFITKDRTIVFTPYELENRDVLQIPYLGYSPVTYQDKVRNIIDKWKDIIVPGHVKLCCDFEQNIYVRTLTSMEKEVEDCTAWFLEIIGTKTDRQLQRIRKCVEINGQAYQSVTNGFKAGMNEFDLYKLIQESYYRAGKENLSFVFDIVSGKRSCEVSGRPTDYRPEPGDAIILDLLPRHQGVYCDHTRTFFIGYAGEKQRFIYRVLLQALEKAEKALKPGVSGREIYQTVYETLAEVSLEKYFPHHAGHGFGLTIYEPPFFIKEGEGTLQPGMVVAIEPGIYLPDEFGIRIENNYLITEDGYELLGNIPVDIEDYIITG